MTARLCTICGRPVAAHNAGQRNRRCLICRVAATMRTFRYIPDPYAVVEYRQDERLEPKRRAA